MAKVKAWKFADSSQPDFPDDFEIAQKAVLQVTDIKSNHNKYYAVELHQADENGSTLYRVFTHYGRTDDLDRNPESGQKECRYYDSLGEAQAGYHSIYNQKTAPRKGYKEVSLAASNIGSQKARGTSSGEVDEKTLAKIEEAEKEKAGKKKKEPPKTLDLHAKIRSLVEYVFAEATNALTTTVNAKITANGIETPLGILTIGQIEKGEDILDEAYALFNKKRARNRADRLEQLTGEFYTLIPHRIGRTRAAIADSVIDSLEKFGEKQETLQLMKDMLQVAGEGEENVLFNQQIDQQYLSLKCHLDYVEKKSDEFKEIEAY
ncbi:MAG: WGR domain-containing protein, partial [Planctomycetota bacterium]|nr:WGR domain-containing protein [Planctomycetota bacterium]